MRVLCCKRCSCGQRLAALTEQRKVKAINRCVNRGGSGDQLILFHNYCSSNRRSNSTEEYFSLFLKHICPSLLQGIYERNSFSSSNTEGRPGELWMRQRGTVQSLFWLSVSMSSREQPTVPSALRTMLRFCAAFSPV